MIIEAEKCDLNFAIDIIEKYPFNYSLEEKKKFYTYDQENNLYICINNLSGDCYVEEFKSLVSVILFFNAYLPIELIRELDKLAFYKNSKLKGVYYER